MTNDERAIRETMDRWMQASSKGDVATVLELMADDKLVAPGCWRATRI